jgi:hypothetical protein
MYLLVNKSYMLMGVFTTENMLFTAISLLKENSDDSCVYYMEFTPDQFDVNLPIFWTMHFEKLKKVEL